MLILSIIKTKLIFSYRANTFIPLESGKHYIIGTEATVIESTENFNEMTDKKRGCQLNLEQRPYYRTNCFFNKLIEEGINNCQCMPWYMHYIEPSSNVCVLGNFTCFENTVQDVDLQENLLKQCPLDCNTIKYTSFILKEEPMNPKLFDYDAVNGDFLGNFLEKKSIGDTYSYYQSIVQINFASPQATIITQDAKVTFSDKLGNIGGTFGVFLGLSFVGLLDELIDFLQPIYKMLQGKKPIKS